MSNSLYKLLNLLLNPIGTSKVIFTLLDNNFSGKSLVYKVVKQSLYFLFIFYLFSISSYLYNTSSHLLAKWQFSNSIKFP